MSASSVAIHIGLFFNYSCQLVDFHKVYLYANFHREKDMLIGHNTEICYFLPSTPVISYLPFSLARVKATTPAILFLSYAYYERI